MINVKESKHNLFTGQKNAGDVEHKLAAGAAYCAEETRVYRLKFMMFPGRTYYMVKNQGSPDHYTVYAKKFEEKNQMKLLNPVGHGVLDTSLQSYLEIKFPILGTSVFMNLYPCQE